MATRIAQEVVSGVNYNSKVAEALNYHANYVYPFWAPSLRRVDRIGAHIFYAMRVGLNWAPGALNGRGDLPPAAAAVAAAAPSGRRGALSRRSSWRRPSAPPAGVSRRCRPLERRTVRSNREGFL